MYKTIAVPARTMRLHTQVPEDIHVALKIVTAGGGQMQDVVTDALRAWLPAALLAAVAQQPAGTPIPNDVIAEHINSAHPDS